eukprot:PLAT3081.1.p2 GENE.PLAT3081.1~~PLAT3081.1.p2  ORF type:complete len:172 (-),score=48.90 PLAT3081.1:97-540(-)
MAEVEEMEIDVGVVAGDEALGAVGEVTVDEAVREVIRKALIHDGLKKGLRECAKELDRRSARLCFLADDCDEPNYKRLVQALCLEYNTPLMEVESGESLGEWTGQCKIDKEGNARKIVRCSCAVITDFGEPTHHLEVLMEELKKRSA